MKSSQRAIQKEQTRQRIIKTAFTEFTHKGLLSTTTADIAKSAGVAHGTVFAHFPTREDLMIAVIHEFGEKITGRIHELATGGGSLREVLEVHLQGLAEYEPFYIRLISEENLLSPEARNTLVLIQSALSFHIIQTAGRDMNLGKIRSLPVHLLFNSWVALIHYYLMHYDLFAPGESVIERYRGELLDYFLSLIKV